MRKPSKLAVCTMARSRVSAAKLRRQQYLSKVQRLQGRVRQRSSGNHEASNLACHLVLAIGLWGQPAAAQGLLGGLLSTVGSKLSSLTSPQPGVIVRTNLGLAGLQNTCSLNGCTVVGNIDGNQNQVFLVRPVQGLLPNLLAGVLRLVTGILDAEPDQTLVIPPSPTSQSTTGNPPPGLWDTTPVNYYGNTVTDGYVNQPAAQIVQISPSSSDFNVSGAGIVADIDTGVDPNHPAFQGVLLQGYDFTRNQPGGSEMNDISMSAPPPCSPARPPT